VRVVIIEDIRDVREGLARLIDGTGGFECARAFRTMEEALDGIEGSSPDVILADIGLPGMDGIEGTRLLYQRLPHVPILALSVYDDDRVFNALCAGASGYLLKNTAPARAMTPPSTFDANALVRRPQALSLTRNPPYRNHQSTSRRSRFGGASRAPGPGGPVVRGRGRPARLPAYLRSYRAGVCGATRNMARLSNGQVRSP